MHILCVVMVDKIKKKTLLMNICFSNYVGVTNTAQGWCL